MSIASFIWKQNGGQPTSPGELCREMHSRTHVFCTMSEILENALHIVAATQSMYYYLLKMLACNKF